MCWNDDYLVIGLGDQCVRNWTNNAKNFQCDNACWDRGYAHIVVMETLSIAPIDTISQTR